MREPEVRVAALGVPNHRLSSHHGSRDDSILRRIRLLITAYFAENNRTIADLVAKKVLKKGKAGGRSTHFELR